jgi:hypothetical protein
MGGFECSTHRPHHGRRLDIIAATQHDRFVAKDYARLRQQGISTARDGIRWHLIEQTPGQYDFSSALPMVRAARDAGVQIIWDLCHYGWPDDIDLFKPEFVHRFARFARAFARVLADETDTIPFFAPINEISFFSWAAGTVGYIYPFATDRGEELKAQLVRATIEAIEAVWEINSRTRIVHTDPIIKVLADPQRPEDLSEAEAYTRTQLDAWDMIGGRFRPEVGGQEKYLDIIGVNYYPHNQWIYRNLPFHPEFKLYRSDPLYYDFRYLLRDIHEHFNRPIFIAETGSDGDDRASWLRYIGDEVQAAMQAGVPIEGLCLYPIVNFPWWDDDAHLHNGLWDYADEHGERVLYQPLAQELQHQRSCIKQIRRTGNGKPHRLELAATVHDMDELAQYLPESCNCSPRSLCQCKQ